MKKMTMSWNVKVALSLAISVVLVSLAVWTGLMCLSPHLGQQAYRDGEYRSAEKHYSIAMRATPDSWEGWRSAFNRGTSRLHVGVDGAREDGNYGGGAGPDGDPGVGTYSLIVDAGAVDGGVSDLEVALERVPEAERQDGQVVEPDAQPECQVRRNLSIGQELQGDAKVAVGDKEGAVAAYALAQETLAPCQESQDNQDQSERQEQKEQDNSPDGGGPDGGDGGDNPDGGDGDQNPDGDQNSDGGENPEGEHNDGGSDPQTRNKEDELNDRNQRGQEEYDEQQGEGHGGGVNW